MKKKWEKKDEINKTETEKKKERKKGLQKEKDPLIISHDDSMSVISQQCKIYSYKILLFI